METLDELWDFSDPASSEIRFRSALEAGRFNRAETLTQLARSLGLQSKFDQAHETLDQTESSEMSPRARVRLLLERGRVHNSSGNKDAARSLFEQAWSEAVSVHEEALAVDAAHMVAITLSGGEALKWNERALEMAENSSDPLARRWRGSLHNNIGWTYHDDFKDFEQAMRHFQLGLEARLEQGNEPTIRIAKWCVARCRRSLGQYEQALTEQLSILDDQGEGYGHEEVAECLLALGREQESRPYFAQAYSKLSADDWFRTNEPERLERLRLLSGISI
jgi:tetratricopeptide (TPR) repeat protein